MEEIMSKISKTAAASMRGGPAEAKKDPFDTNEKKIHELRNQRANRLAVIRYDFIDALIEEYDKLLNGYKELEKSHAQLFLDNKRLITLAEDAERELESIKSGPSII